MLFAACGDVATTTEATKATDATTEATTEATTTEATTTATTAAKVCTHDYKVLEGTAPGVFTEGNGKFECKICGEKYEGTLPATKKIKILAIGNSFSVDAMESHLHKVFTNLGIEATLGNLYIGGCSLDTHWDNITNDKKAYTYYYKASGKSQFSGLSNRSVSSTLKSQDWDIITIQQVSQDSGRPETFNNLQNILDYIEANKTNPDAKIFWHMTWAYAQNSSHSGFANYGKDQMTMYNAIVNAAQNYILKYEAIDGVIPSGTAIQNLRTSYIGDNLTRDGYHLNYSGDTVGRLTASVTWAAYCTGADLTNFTYENKAYPSVAEKVPAIIDAVQNAIKNPFEVTQSKYPPDAPVVTPNAALTEEDKAILKAGGITNPDNYEVLSLDLKMHSYYNSSSSSVLTSASNSNASNLVNFIATQIFEKDQLPNGTVIYIKKGYQYRPEGWTALSAKTASRPGNVTTEYVVVDNAWWGSFNYRAFNIAIEGNKEVIGESDKGALKIYVPKAPSEEEPKETTMPTKEDLADTTKYTKIDLDFKIKAYYNSSDSSYKSTLISSANSTASNIPNFIATKIFSKSDLPNGTVIVVDSGYQYRPEGWTALDKANSGSARPGNVTTAMVVVDDAWWGSFNYRAFNISKVPAAAMSESDTVHFSIYVPVK